MQTEELLDQVCSDKAVDVCEFGLYGLIPRANSFLRESYERYASNGTFSSAARIEVVDEISQECERILHDLINLQYPDHGIIGDYFKPYNVDSDYVWVLSPIDGKREFEDKLAGFFSTTIGLLKDGKPYLGFISDPLGHKLWVGENRKCSVHPFFAPRKRAETIDKAIITVTSDQAIQESDYKDNINALLSQCSHIYKRGNANGAGHVSCGALDLVCECDLTIKDLAVIIPVLRSSNAYIFDFEGNTLNDIDFTLPEDLNKKYSLVAGLNENVVQEALQILQKN